MKARHIALASLTVLAIGVVFAALFTPATAVIKYKTKFKPMSWVYDSVPTGYWNGSISAARFDPATVDPATVKLTGETAGRTIYPVAYQVKYFGKNQFVASYKPSDMKALLTDMLVFHHFYGVPGNYTLFLVSSGNLYDGGAFEATGKIVVIIPVSPS